MNSTVKATHWRSLRTFSRIFSESSKMDALMVCLRLRTLGYSVNRNILRGGFPIAVQAAMPDFL